MLQIHERFCSCSLECPVTCFSFRALQLDCCSSWTCSNIH